MRTPHHGRPGTHRSASKPNCRSSLTGLLPAALAALALPAAAQSTAPPEQVVVVGSSSAQRIVDAPYAVSVVDADALRAGGLMVNLSEALARVPGLVVNNRQNYAQDLQINSRGFGARASFGVRGMRLYADGIPAAGPDGQGQVSHFDLAGAQQVEVLRGPFSVLYGSSSGGVISLVSAEPARRSLGLDLDAGSFGLQQWRTTLSAPLAGGFSLRASASGLQTDGPRPQSAAERQLATLRLGYRDDKDRVVFSAGYLDQPALDPLGLTRAQFDADPRQTTPQARQFDTRKNTRQTQAGASWSHRLRPGDGLQRLQLSAYAGERSVTQWQSIAAETQANPRHPGGVIDFDRRFSGGELRTLWRWGAFGLVLGAAADEQRENRRGFENFIGTGSARVLGVTGRLRRDEANRVRTQDAFAQAEWELGPSWSASAGLRRGRITLNSADRFLANGDDSGALDFSYTLPVLALRWQPSPQWTAYLNAGRGFEAPTLNELAYRSDGSAGFNFALKPQRSRQWEAGLKWRAGSAALDAALFRADSTDEIGVQTNSGGRSSFRNVGRTARQGLELAWRWQPAPAWRVETSATWLDATYRDPFLACAGTPCTAPTLPVPAGNRIAGTLARAAFGELAWRVQPTLELALEARAQGRLPVNDVNSDFAAGHVLVNARLRHTLAWGDSTLETLLRLENLADRSVVGSVIVGEGNGRFFEPAPGRSWVLGLRWSLAF